MRSSAAFAGKSSAERRENLPPKRRSYLINHMAGPLLTTCSLQYITEKDGGLEWNRKMLDRIEAFDPALMRCLRKHFVGRISLLPGKAGRRFVIFLYRAGRKLARF